MERFELKILRSLAPEASVSASSTTSAMIFLQRDPDNSALILARYAPCVNIPLVHSIESICRNGYDTFAGRMDCFWKEVDIIRTVQEYRRCFSKDDILKLSIFGLRFSSSNICLASSKIASAFYHQKRKIQSRSFFWEECQKLNGSGSRPSTSQKATQSNHAL